MQTCILLVEDDNRVRMALVYMLTSAGYQVTPAASGEEALGLLKEDSFDVVVTDIRLGDVDGIEVLHAAREEKPPPAVILLTGYGSLETAIAALRAGAFDYLLKPCAPAALLACVQNAVQRRTSEQRQAEALDHIAQIIAQAQQGMPDDQQIEQTNHIPTPEQVPSEETPPRIQIGNLCIDQSRHTIFFAGQPVHVTPTEYSLLACLARAGERVLSYRDIARQTHGHDVNEEEAHALLKTHIRNLRRKIDPKYLVSVRGVGYVLVAPDE